MRTVNLRFLLVTAGLVVIVAIGAHLLHGIQLRRSTGILLTQGKQKLDEGRPGDAVSYLARYASLAPHDAQAQALLADTLADMNQPGPAMKWYEQALLRDAGMHDARMRLAELSIATRRFPEAKGHLQDFLIKYREEDPRVYYLLGLAHQGLADYDQAIARLREAIERDPKLVEAYLPLAKLLRDQRQQPEQADALLDQAVAANPQSERALIARADYRAEYRLPGVMDDVRAAVELAPENPEIMFRAAQTTLALAGESEAERQPIIVQAEGYVERGRKLTPKYPGWFMALAQADRLRGQPDDAIGHLEEGLQATPNDGDLQWNLADLCAQQKRFDEARGIVSRLQGQNYPRPPLEYLLAIIDAGNRRYVEASERLSKVRGQLEPWPELARQSEFWLGLCYEQLGEYGLQLTAFRNASKIDPAWVPARRWLASSLARTGRIDEAITEYTELTRLTGVPREVYRELARLLVLRDLQQRDQRIDWTPTLAFLDRAEQADSEADDYRLLRVEIAAARGDRQAARKLLEEGVAQRPESLRLALALASLEQAEEKWDAAAALLDAATEQHGDSVELRLARLRYLVQRSGADAFDQIAGLESQPLEANEESLQKWRTSLAAAYFTIGKPEEAGRVWRAAAAAEPDNVMLRMFLFDLAIAQKNDAEMKTLLAEVKRIERGAGGPLWRYGEAVRLIMQARDGQPGEQAQAEALQTAERLLEEAKAARQSWARIPLLQAEIANLRGDYPEEIEYYLLAIEMGENNSSVIRRAVELLYRQQRYAEADRVLRRFEQTQLPITGDLGRLAADVSFQVEDFSRAMSIAAQVIGDSEKYEDLVWIGQLHSSMGEHDQAETKLRRATEVKPDAPEAWLALVRHFVGRDDRKQAKATIDALRNNLPEGPSRAFVEAICYATMGDFGSAQREFDAAAQDPAASSIVLRAAAEFYLSRGAIAQGHPLLDRLLKSKDLSADDANWARRNLALVMVSQESPAEKEEGLQLVDSNLRANPLSVDDLRAKAICLEAIGGNERLEQSLALVEQLLNSGRVAPDDLLLAFRLSTALGRQNESRRYLEQHTFENSADPRNLVRYVRFLMDKQEYREAETWVARLKEAAVNAHQATPDSAADPQLASAARPFLQAAIGFQAELLLRRGQAAEAVQYIKNAIAKEETPANGKLSPTEAVQLMEGLARLGGKVENVDADEQKLLHAAAEEVLRENAESSPDASAGLIAFLARDQRVDEAAAQWRRSYNPAEPETLALAAASLATDPRLQQDDLLAMTRQVGESAAANPSREVRSAYAQLLTFAGQRDEAISVYRSLLADSPSDVGVMNNLALFLALHSGQAEEALSLINRAIELAGPASSLLDSRAMVLLELKQPKEAVADLQTALQQAPDGGKWLHLAAAYEQLQQPEKVTEAMAEAAKIGINPATLHPLERDRYGALLKRLEQ